MTAKRTHGPCTCIEAYTRIKSHRADCPTLYPAQQEQDALTRLVHFVRFDMAGTQDDREQALALISEAREEQRKAVESAKNEVIEQVARDFDSEACDLRDYCQHETCARWRRMSARIRGFKVAES